MLFRFKIVMGLVLVVKVFTFGQQPNFIPIHSNGGWNFFDTSSNRIFGSFDNFFWNGKSNLLIVKKDNNFALFDAEIDSLSDFIYEQKNEIKDMLALKKDSIWCFFKNRLKPEITIKADTFYVLDCNLLFKRGVEYALYTDELSLVVPFGNYLIGE